MEMPDDGHELFPPHLPVAPQHVVSADSRSDMPSAQSGSVLAQKFGFLSI